MDITKGLKKELVIYFAYQAIFVVLFLVAFHFITPAHLIVLF